MPVSPQEIAKQMQEEEEKRTKRRSRGQEAHSEGTDRVCHCSAFFLLAGCKSCDISPQL